MKFLNIRNIAYNCSVIHALRSNDTAHTFFKDKRQAFSPITQSIYFSGQALTVGLLFVLSNLKTKCMLDLKAIQTSAQKVVGSGQLCLISSAQERRFFRRAFSFLSVFSYGSFFSFFSFKTC
jgi:hypothetical protein